MLRVPCGIAPSFDNGFMVWKRSPMFDSLVANWLQDLNSTNRYNNDQPPLTRAAEATTGFKVGILPHAWQVKYIPILGEKWGTAKIHRTLVLHGPAHLAAGTHFGACHILNRHVNRKRSFVRNETSKAIREVFSQAECEEVCDNRCGTKEMDWELDFRIMSKERYYALYDTKH